MRILTLIWATMIGVSLLAVSPALASDVGCGDTIGLKETVVLHEDIGLCDNSFVNWALRVDSRSTLDLNGFTIFCHGVIRPVGILLVGERSKVMNGEVVDCGDGVRIDGINPGRHKVENVTVEDSQFRGFIVSTSRNSLLRNHAIGSGGDGFSLFGFDPDHNKLIDNSSHYNDDDGFDIGRISVTNNYLEGNDAIENRDNGFEVAGEFSTFLRNTAAMNINWGFFFEGLANNNNVERNTASENGTTLTNGGVLFDGPDGNKITRNRAIDNIGFGIELVYPASNNVVSRNQARGNTNLDVADNNANNGVGLCGTNVWSMNVFTTFGNPCLD